MEGDKSRNTAVLYHLQKHAPSCKIEAYSKSAVAGTVHQAKGQLITDCETNFDIIALFITCWLVMPNHAARCIQKWESVPKEPYPQPCCTTVM